MAAYLFNHYTIHDALFKMLKIIVLESQKYCDNQT